jgi:hypothetical protein
VSPMVLAHLVPWIKRDLLQLWPEGSVVVPDLSKSDVDLFLARLFRPNRAQCLPAKKSSDAIGNVIDCLRIPLDPDDRCLRWHVMCNPGKAFYCVGEPNQAPNRRSNRTVKRKWTWTLKNNMAQKIASCKGITD